MDMKHLNIRVTGHVQGVNFRESARAFAQDAGVTGFIRNEPDGSVWVEAEGESEALDRLVKWLHEGPPGAQVEAVSARESSAQNYAQFTVAE